MSYEIERKFLLSSNAWRDLGIGKLYRQGYLVSEEGCTVRIRTKGSTGWLTVKGPSENGMRREYEYEISLSDALYMLKHFCKKPLIEKTRYTIPIPPFVWEVDEFAGENQGLIVAEVELESREQSVPLPVWIGREVTDESRFYNACLVSYPYSVWSDEEKAN